MMFTADVKHGERAEIEAQRAKVLEALLASSDPQDRVMGRLMEKLYPALQGWVDHEEKQGTAMGDCGIALAKVVTSEVANIVLAISKQELRAGSLRTFGRIISRGFHSIANRFGDDSGCDCEACQEEQTAEARHEPQHAKQRMH